MDEIFCSKLQFQFINFNSIFLNKQFQFQNWNCPSIPIPELNWPHVWERQMRILTIKQFLVRKNTAESGCLHIINTVS